VATASEPTAEIRVTNNLEEGRYEAWLGDVVAGFSEYKLRPGRIVFTHTIVEPKFEGRGIGSKLVREELEDVRARGLKVIPYCPFVRAYIRRHSEYQDLLSAPDGR
jgi:predicted GNAT family acetyltransferase